MKIDVFNHIIPEKYRKALEKKLPPAIYEPTIVRQSAFTSLFDLENRFRIMDKFDGLQQVLTLAAPYIERVAEPKLATELARIGNDALAELVEKYPDRFVAAVGSLPMNDVDAALDEIDRTINELSFRGIQITTNINGKPLDLPEFMSLYEKMAEYDLPILIHPVRYDSTPDYPGEDVSKYEIWSIFGWPYETTAAMTRLVFGKVLHKFPDIKFITHHCGAMVPYFVKRISSFYNYREMRGKGKFNYKRGLTKSPIAYFQMFYGDTALNGYAPGLMCGYSFFGADHILFGTDMPYDSQNGYLILKETIESVEQMQIPDAEKAMIFSSNAKKLLRLPV